MQIVAIGCDPNAASAKSKMMEILSKKGCQVADFGSDDPIYANTAIAVAEYVAAGKADCGILICGTGIGMSIAANKVRGAYAALLSDAYSAQRAKKSNDANIACFGAFTLGEKLMETLMNIWLENEYEKGTSSEEKVQRYQEYDIRRG